MPLSAAHPNPAQVQIDPSGRWLLVTEKLTNLIDVYRIHEDGSQGARTSFPSVGLYPFGMAFNPARPQEFIVDDGFGFAPVDLSILTGLESQRDKQLWRTVILTPFDGIKINAGIRAGVTLLLDSLKNALAGETLLSR